MKTTRKLLSLLLALALLLTAFPAATAEEAQIAEPQQEQTLTRTKTCRRPSAPWPRRPR